MNLFRPRSPALADGGLVLVGGQPVRLRVNTRARRISLRIDSRSREAIATSPTVRGLADAVRFAETRADWIAERLAAVPEAIALRPGLVLPVRGQPCRLEKAAMRMTPRLHPARDGEPQRLVASGAGEAFGRAAVRALKTEALEAVTAHTLRYAARLRQPAPAISVADAKGRWGSCRQAGRGKPAAMRYSWRLILAPDWVLDYVCAHEAAHLIEGNHGPRFWALVDEIYGDPGKARRWLRAHTAELKAYAA